MKKVFVCASIVRLITTLSLIAAVGVATTVAWSAEKKLSSFDRGRAQDILQNIAGDIRKHYYDPKFHGVDWDAKVKEAKEKIDKTDSMNMALAHIAAALDSLHDSHTFFLPPPHAYQLDYGWQMEMIGDRCYIVRVRPKTDAESKGLKPGDEVLSIDGYTPDRNNLSKMQYMMNVLRPQPALQLVLRDPAGTQRQVDVTAHIRPLVLVKDITGEGIWEVIREEEAQEHLMRLRYAEMEELMIVKFPVFDFSESEIYGLLGRMRKHKAVILDLRGNPGGSEDTLKCLLGSMFENDVTIGNRVGRETKKEAVVAKHGRNPFQGKLIVLVDSRSASAAELLARVVQIEKRGSIMGDQSSGSVMEAKHYSYALGQDRVIFFGASITHADLIMSDGKSLEEVGVAPDTTALPTAQDMASGRDPVLAGAAEALGVKLSAEEAGKMFPYEWPPE